MALVREIDSGINTGQISTTAPASVHDSLVIEVGAPLNTTWTYQEWVAAMSKVSFSLCLLGSEQIELDDLDPDIAVGQWVSWHPLTFNGAAWIVAGRYRDEFARCNGYWQLTKMVFTPQICNRWEAGWDGAPLKLESVGR